MAYYLGINGGGIKMKIAINHGKKEALYIGIGRPSSKDFVSRNQTFTFLINT